jgi:hypothetical protein
MTASSNGVWSYYVTNAQFCTYEDMVTAGGTGHGFNFTGACNGSVFKRLYAYTPGNGNSDNGIICCDDTSNALLEDIYIYNAGDTCAVFRGGVLINGITIDTCKYSFGGHGIYISGDDYAAEAATYVRNATISNTNYDAIYVNAAAGGHRIHNPVMSSIGRNEIVTAAEERNKQDPLVTITKYNGTDGDDRMYWSSYYVAKDTANARSGSCMALTANSGNTRMWVYRLGRVKVTSTSGNMTLGIYLKDDASCDGTVRLYALQQLEFVAPSDYHTTVTPATSYGQHTITVSSSDLVLNAYVELWIAVNAQAAGTLYIDDFSASQ